MIDIIVYHKQPILRISDEVTKRKVQFGLAKAKIISANIDEINKFINEVENELASRK